jgi:hypothetical protein
VTEPGPDPYERRDAQGALLCAAKAKSTGGLCTSRALIGTNPPRCRIHAGRKSATIRAERQVALTADRIYGQYPGVDRTTNDNSLDDLLRIKNEALRWLEVCRTMLGGLSEVRYKSRSAGEQLRAEVALWERSLDRCARICADLVRLGIEDRVMRTNTHITNQDAERMHEAVILSLAELGHDPHDPTTTQVVARHIRNATQPREPA